MEGVQRSTRLNYNQGGWGTFAGFRSFLIFAAFALSAVSVNQIRPASATIRVGVMDLELEFPLSKSINKFGLNPSTYSLQNEPFPVISQGMKDGSVWVMYNHCPDADYFQEKEANRVGMVGNNYIGCEAHIAHYDGSSGKRIGGEVIFADYYKYPMQRNIGFFAHGPDDGEHSNTFVLGIWTAQCSKLENVCLCTNDKCGFDTSKNNACNAGWRGVPGVTYCQNEGWLGGANGTGWSCGKAKYNVGTLLAPVNGGQVPAKLILVKLNSSGKVIWEQDAFYFDGDQNDSGSTIVGGIAKFQDPDLKREVEDWAYAWVHSSNMGNICNYHWGCQGHIHRATDGKKAEERLWCSHCNGRFLTYDEQTRQFAFACGTDGVPGVIFNKTKVIGRGNFGNINTSNDNTHRDVHPVVSHFRGDVWLILYAYIATDLDKDSNDLRLLHYDVKAKKILFSKVLTETPTYSDGGAHRLTKFGPDTWLMAWQAQGRRLLTEIDAWGNFVGDIFDVTEDINWGGSQKDWWHWPSNDIGYVWWWDQTVSFEEKGKLIVTGGFKANKVLRLVRIRGYTSKGDCIGKFLPMEFTCNQCCEIREKYVVERPADGGKDCPYKDGEIRRKPCKGGACPMLQRESAEQAFTKSDSPGGGGAELGIDGNMDTVAANWTNYGNFPLTWYKVTLTHKSRVKGVSYFVQKKAQPDIDLNVLFYDAEKQLLARCYLNGKNQPADNHDKDTPIDPDGCSGLNVIGVKQVMVIPVSAGPWAWLHIRELQIFGEACTC
ncbi:transmembrane protein [Cystoisospora suis]|uniref:Transmembrane protein n=1 Tax=Cystoisospora suis TaxID=483139 RepID=A0A2C6KZV1_9APIC|nr:transmembrane protein [Cystoisospora suis]